jgi:hypothetical protein
MFAEEILLTYSRSFFFLRYVLGLGIGCSLKFLLKVGVEESIVNALRIADQGSAV